MAASTPRVDTEIPFAIYDLELGTHVSAATQQGGITGTIVDAHAVGTTRAEYEVAHRDFLHAAVHRWVRAADLTAVHAGGEWWAISW